MQITWASFGGMEWAQVTDYLFGTHQKIPDGQTDIAFWEKVEPAGVKSGFGALAQVTPFWACGFLFNGSQANSIYLPWGI